MHWLMNYCDDQCFFYSINISIEYNEAHLSHNQSPSQWYVHEYVKIIVLQLTFTISPKLLICKSPQKEILSRETKQTLSIILEIRNMAANWIRIQSRKLNMLVTQKTTNHIHVFGSGEWMIEREADRNVLQIKYIPSAFSTLYYCIDPQNVV